MQSEPRPVPGRFSGARVLVTGAGRGIGAATATRFAAEGAVVIVNDISPDAAAATVDRIAASGGRAVVQAFDHADEDAVSAAFDAIGRDGGLDALVANAGTAEQQSPIEATPVGVHDRLYRANVLGTLLVCCGAIPLLREARTGSIVITGSVAGLGASPMMAGYAATKAAVISLARSLAAELAPDVRVNSVCPGGTLTPLLERVVGAERIRASSAAVPLGRLADPEDVAACISFLASGDARHVTGATLVVDGGSSLTRITAGN